jgi:hypothetical protein
MQCLAYLFQKKGSSSDPSLIAPNRLLTLLRVTGLAAAADALVTVKSHYPEVDMVKIKEGADTTKDLQALELEVDEAANEVMENIDFEGDGGPSGDGGDGGDGGDQ